MTEKHWQATCGFVSWQITHCLHMKVIKAVWILRESLLPVVETASDIVGIKCTQISISTGQA